MLTPEYLKPGDTIAIIATARKISKEELAPAIAVFESWGLKVVFGNNLFKSDNQFSGTDEERAADLQDAMDNPDIKAVISGRGGYGTVRIIDQINFEKFQADPKWIIGYSDITVLHSHIHTNCEVETLHATMPINFPKDGTTNNAVETLRKALFGEEVIYSYSEGSGNQIKGQAQGQIIGGNLSLLYALSGSDSDIDTTGKILFIEDLDEYLYHIDRMMVQLDRSGKLKYLSGLIVGGMSDMKDNAVPFGRNAEQIIYDIVKKYNFPVCFGFPAGHIVDNRALIMGRKVTLSVDNTVSLSF